MRLRGATLLLAAGLAAAGCGGGGAGPDAGDGGIDANGDGGADTAGDGALPATCGNVPPCGGDVVGEWTFVETCDSAVSVAASKARFATMAAQSWCVGQTLVDIEPEASGSLVLDAAGNYSLAIVFGGYLVINYPASCLRGLSCADAQAGFQSQIDDGTFQMPAVTSITCTGTSGCVCRAAVDAPRAETGTYAVSGSALTFTAASGVVVDKSYCVAENKLHILDTTTASTGQTSIDSDLIATKP